MFLHNKSLISANHYELSCYIIEILYSLSIEIFMEKCKLRNTTCIQFPLSWSQQHKRNVSKYVSGLESYDVLAGLLLAFIYVFNDTVRVYSYFSAKGQ